MADRFEDLRTYVTVVDCGGVNSAAARLGIAKSAVSRRLSDLETRLGVTLVERAKRSFEVSAIGREYYRQASDILEALRRLDEGVTSPERPDAVTVAAARDILTHLVAPAVARVRELGDAPPFRLAQVDDEAQADVTITLASAAPDGGTNHLLGSAAGVTCASRAYLDRRGTPGTSSDLADHDGVAVEGQDVGGWSGGEATGRAPRIVLTVTDVEAAAAAAVAGVGLVRLPIYVAQAALDDGRLIALPVGSPDLHTLHARLRPNVGRAAAQLVDELKRSLRKR